MNRQSSQKAKGSEEKRYVETRKADYTTLMHEEFVRSTVSDSVIKDGGFFFYSIVTFKVETYPLGWVVRRKEDDFYALRRYLTRRFPNILIPPLKPFKRKFEPKSLRKKERFLTVSRGSLT